MEASGDRRDTAETAVRLAVAVKRLQARIREEAGVTSTGLSVAQVSIFSRLVHEGPVTAASLAVAEHVSQQAIAQSLAGLKAGGLVSVTPDPADGRKSLLEVTAAGRALFASSRQDKRSHNDADRLRKYLARFELSFEEVRSGASAGSVLR